MLQKRCQHALHCLRTSDAQPTNLAVAVAVQLGRVTVKSHHDDVGQREVCVGRPPPSQLDQQHAKGPDVCTLVVPASGGG